MADAATDEMGQSELLSAGLLPPRLQSQLRQSALREVIRPCADALLALPDSPRPATAARPLPA